MKKYPEETSGETSFRAISEETPVKVRMATAWGVIATIVATTIWLTIIMVRIHNENQMDHSKMMMGITELNVRSENWVTHAQFEEVVMYVVSQTHSNELTYWQLNDIRNSIRYRLQRPKP